VIEFFNPWWEDFDGDRRLVGRNGRRPRKEKPVSDQEQLEPRDDDDAADVEGHGFDAKDSLDSRDATEEPPDVEGHSFDAMDAAAAFDAPAAVDSHDAMDAHDAMDSHD
jgi:hypothetical protein